mmetsp:Transcript_24874/g.18811  ORF Transcript_24874/g.18811 Transcript_24874/m.18811 type:complete len:90 (+) Transcript_24874:807-1076(+)
MVMPLLIFLFLFIILISATVDYNLNSYTADLSNGSNLRKLGFWTDQILTFALALSGQYIFFSALNTYGTFWVIGSLTVMGGVLHYFVLE